MNRMAQRPAHVRRLVASVTAALALSFFGGAAAQLVHVDHAAGHITAEKWPRAKSLVG